MYSRTGNAVFHDIKSITEACPIVHHKVMSNNSLEHYVISEL